MISIVKGWLVDNALEPFAWSEFWVGTVSGAVSGIVLYETILMIFIK